MRHHPYFCKKKIIGKLINLLRYYGRNPLNQLKVNNLESCRQWSIGKTSAKTIKFLKLFFTFLLNKGNPSVM